MGGFRRVKQRDPRPKKMKREKVRPCRVSKKRRQLEERREKPGAEGPSEKRGKEFAKRSGGGEESSMGAASAPGWSSPDGESRNRKAALPESRGGQLLRSLQGRRGEARRKNFQRRDRTSSDIKTSLTGFKRRGRGGAETGGSDRP